MRVVLDGESCSIIYWSYGFFQEFSDGEQNECKGVVGG